MNERDILKKLIVEWSEQKLPEIIEREQEIKVVKRKIKKIISVVGVRRSGKTYLLYQTIKKLQNNTPKKNILYINLEDERIPIYTPGYLTDLLDAHTEIFGERKETLYLFLDEIQNIPKWEKYLRRIHDTEADIQIVITGSSSKLLSKEIATSLRGRTLSLKVHPFSFREFLKVKGFTYDTRTLQYSKKKPLLFNYLREYMEFGGFPEVILEEKRNKTLLLQEYFNAIFHRDIVDRYKIRNIKLMETFLKLLINYSSRYFSISRIEKTLKSQGFKLSKNTLIEYLGYAESTFLVYPVPIFSYKIKDQTQYPKKIYCIDTGLRNATTFRFTEDLGRLAENMVFIELMKRNREVYYWKDSEQKEVDFVIKEGLKARELIQVCWDINNETREREVKALTKAMDEFGLEEGIIITDDHETVEEINGKTITYRPLWKWLLQ